MEIPRHTLRPASHLTSSRISEEEEEKDEGSRDFAVLMLIQLAALGSAIGLYKYSSFPYVMGIKKRPL